MTWMKHEIAAGHKNAGAIPISTPQQQRLMHRTFKAGSTRMIGTYIDEFIMFCAGLWMTCVGFGYLSFSRNQAHKLPLVRHFMWMGPLLLVITIVLAVAS
jgi:hypothetical protein